MNRATLLRFMQGHSLAVQASVSHSGAPQAAVVGIIVTDDFHIVFDSLRSSRKVANLRQNPKISLVIGGLLEGDERTVQYDGVADEPMGEELELLKNLYFNRFPDGHARQVARELIHIRARPQWIRYSDFNESPPEIVEFDFDVPR